MKKRWCQVVRNLLFCALIAVTLSIAAWASDVVASGTSSDNLTWILDSDGVLTIAGTGEMKTYEFDWSYYESTAPWYKYRKKVTKLVIEDGVTSISRYAFYDMTNLNEIVIGDTVETIGDHAFYCTNYATKISIGTGVKSVGSGAFADFVALEELHIKDLDLWCQLDYGNPFNRTRGYLYVNDEKITDLVIPDGITTIGSNAFYNMYISTVTIPESVTKIGSGAFSNTDLTEIEIPESVTEIDSGAFAGLAIQEIKLPDGITEIANSLFSSCSNLSTIEIPAGVERIGSSAFYACTSLEKLTIPGNVTSIGECAFSHCTSLDTITILGNITSIGRAAFYECTALKEITLPDSVTSMGGQVFQGCTSLETIAIPDAVQTIGVLFFSECTALTEVELPDSLETIEEHAFYGCTALSSVTIPAQVTSIGEKAFYNCSALTSVEFPDSMEKLGNYVFQNCVSLQKVTLPSGLTEVGMYSFDGCSGLEEIVLADTVNILGVYAFRNCTSVSEIVFPASVTEIQTSCFEGCTMLGRMWFEGEAPTIQATAFNRVCATCYYVPGDTWTAEILTEDFGGDLFWTYEGEENPDDYYVCGDDIIWALSEDGVLSISGTGAMYDYSVDELQYAPWYEGRNNITAIEIGDGVTHIGDAAFYGCSQVTGELVLPDTIVSIGERAFENCRATSIVWSGNLESIGAYAFKSTKFTELILPEGVTTIGEGAFSNSQLTNAVLPDSLTYIPDRMFYASYYLRTVDFPEVIYTIGNYSFCECYGLCSVVLPEGLVSIGNGAFSTCGPYDLYHFYYSCGSFSSVTLPSTLKSIGASAFWYCQSLTTINIPDGVTCIEQGTFGYCYRLQEIEIPAHIDSIGSSALCGCKNLEKITFRWDAPEIDEKTFNTQVTADCYYPSNNTAWTSDMLQNYSANQLTWIATEMEQPADGAGDESGNGTGETEGQESGDDGESGDGEDSGGDSEPETGDPENSGSTGGSGNTGGGNETGGSKTDGDESSGPVTGETGSGENNGPAIITQPENYEGTVGDIAVFSVKTSGDNLKYQWQYSKSGVYWYDSGLDGNDSNTLRVTLSQGRDGQQYRCLVTDANGNIAVSEVATMCIKQVLLEITAQPENQSGNIGETVTFHIIGSGENLSYQWQYSKSGAYWYNSGSTGSNTDTLSVEILAKRDGQMYRCVITDANGNSVASDVATMTVTKNQLEITAQPENQSGNIGDVVEFTVVANGTGLSFQWQYSKSGTYWYDSGLDGSNTSTLNVAITKGRDGQMYRCVITDVNGNTVTSVAATMNVSENKPEITSQPESQSGNIGEMVEFTVEVNGEGLSHQWQYSKSGTYWYDSSSAGSDTNSLSVEVLAKRDGQMYRCVITDTNGNISVSEVAILEVSK